MPDYHYTQRWFETARAPKMWQALIPRLPARKAFLEIGSYEGMSTVWTVENMLEDGGSITCIDTWQGDETMTDMQAMESAEGLFDGNMELLSRAHPERSVRKEKGTSYDTLSRLIGSNGEASFDFIYVDGSHLAPSVLIDACMAWPLLKPGGVMVFDDYLWGNSRDILHRPKLAIDAFLNIFSEQLSPVFIHQQLAVQKVAGVERS